MKTSPSSQATFLDETEFPLMSSPADFPAKISRLAALSKGLERALEAGYGLSALDLLAKYDPVTHSLRTSQTCLVAQVNNQADGLAEFSATWPKRGMMRNGQIYQLPTLGPGIGGAESGYLPTPTKSNAKGAAKSRYFRSEQSRGNLHEDLRDGPEDPIYPHPDFVELMMGFPIGWGELKRVGTP